MSKRSPEHTRFIEYPFQFKLSPELVAKRSNHRMVRVSHACCFCGSVKVLGDAQKRSALKGNRVFCDLECACNWKSVYYATDDYEHNRRRRERRVARVAREREEMLARVEARRDMLKKQKEETKRRNAEKRKADWQSGMVTCLRCGKQKWFEKHSKKKLFCSHKCAAKHQRSNREHLLRSRSVGERIGLAQLAKKSKWRCVKCNVKCVKPEGYNLDNEATIDHIIPLSKNGLHAWSNVQLLCRRCNTAKGDTIDPGVQLMLPLYGDN